MKNNKWFTLIELIITFTIISILAWISYLGTSLIDESNIENKKLEVEVFINNWISKIIKNKESSFYLYLNNQWEESEYLYSYLELNDCENLNPDLIYDWFEKTNWDFYLTWSLLSNISWALSYKKERNSYNKIDSIWSNFLLNVNDGETLKWDLYWTWSIYEYWNSIKTNVKCWELEIFNLQFDNKNKYLIKNIKYLTSNTEENSNKIILKYSINNMKPELYINWLNTQRIFFEYYKIILENINNNLQNELEI